MRFDKFTQKAQSALVDAQHLAEEYGHHAGPEHLLTALLHQEGGVVPTIVAKIGVNASLLDQSVQRAMNALPSMSGASSQIGMGRDSSTLLQEAQQIAGNMKDEYVSTEHLLMAMASSNVGGEIADAPGAPRTGLQRHFAGIGFGARQPTRNHR